MSIGVAFNFEFEHQAMTGQFLRRARLDVTGLALGSNVVPHGLTVVGGGGVVSAKPLEIQIEPTSSNTFWEYQAADATNIYIGAGTGGGSTLSLYVSY